MKARISWAALFFFKVPALSEIVFVSKSLQVQGRLFLVKKCGSCRPLLFFVSVFWSLQHVFGQV